MYAWGAFAVARFTGRTDAVDLVGHGVFAVIAAGLFVWASKRQQTSELRRPT
jgi:steroid 5-alpha reductase family enzyme